MVNWLVGVVRGRSKVIIEIDNREIFVRVIFLLVFSFFLEMQRIILHILRIFKFKGQLFEQKNPLTIFGSCKYK